MTILVIRGRTSDSGIFVKALKRPVIYSLPQNGSGTPVSQKAGPEPDNQNLLQKGKLWQEHI